MIARISLLFAFVILCLLPPPARAATLLQVTGTSSVTLSLGDNFDFVEAIEFAHVDLSGGTVNNELILLDQATAQISDGSVLNALNVFQDGVATLLAGADDLTVDGVPVPLPATLGASDCPVCDIAVTLAGDGSFTTTGLVAQNGQIVVTAVPEPSSFALAGFGLLGIALCGRRHWA